VFANAKNPCISRPELVLVTILVTRAPFRLQKLHPRPFLTQSSCVPACPPSRPSQVPVEPVLTNAASPRYILHAPGSQRFAPPSCRCRPSGPSALVGGCTGLLLLWTGRVVLFTRTQSGSRALRGPSPTPTLSTGTLPNQGLPRRIYAAASPRHSKGHTSFEVWCRCLVRLPSTLFDSLPSTSGFQTAVANARRLPPTADTSSVTITLNESSPSVDPCIVPLSCNVRRLRPAVG